jgi:hypothetical protein
MTQEMIKYQRSVQYCPRGVLPQAQDRRTPPLLQTDGCKLVLGQPGMQLDALLVIGSHVGAENQTQLI